jgi:hypothetical protein
MRFLNLGFFLKKGFNKIHKNYHLTNFLSKIKFKNYQNLSLNLKSQKVNIKVFSILFFALNTSKVLA